jgi:hypothetical protein
MINSPIYVFDHIGCGFTLSDNKFLIGQKLKGYNTLNKSHVGSYIPYLVRNKDQWETGVGVVCDYGDIYVERHKVVSSSDNNQAVSFYDDASNQFYIFANQYNFDTAFNNIVVKTQSFTAPSVTATYLIDSTEDTVDIALPNIANAENLIIEIKHIDGDNGVLIRDHNKQILFSLPSQSSSRLTSYKNYWIDLNNITTEHTMSAQNSTSEDNVFTSLSDPNGDAGAFQYNDGLGQFAASSVYWDSIDQKLLIGSSNESEAKDIIPTSGNFATIFNNTKNNSDFIVQGSGNKNFFFAYDGRIGLNIPSGSRPQTIFHIVNTACSEGIRLDNRSSCHPANITLFHKPIASTITDNQIIGEIHLSSISSDNANNDIDYVRLRARSKNADEATRKGQFDVVVSNTGTYTTTISSSADSTDLGYGNKNLSVHSASGITIKSNNSSISVTDNVASTTSTTINHNANTLNLSANNINITSQNVVVGSGNAGSLTAPTISANSLISNNISIPSIPLDSILTVNEAGTITSGSQVRLPIPSGKFLTTSQNGYIVGDYNINDYFKTEGDIFWTKYPDRSANICLRQIVFNDAVPLEEYKVGDQIGIRIGDDVFYRNISEISVDNNIIGSMLVNQAVTPADTPDVSIFSVTNGGYLTIEKSVPDGVVSDSTANVLSIRPMTDTQFNTGRKDINFKVFGSDPVPALSIKSNIGRIETPSGFYHFFSMYLPKCEPCPRDRIAQDYDPFPITINPSGEGLTAQNVSAHYNQVDSIDDPVFSGILSSVGTNGLSSYYGTYDQNGNVYEWIEDSSITSRSAYQYVAGGSWRTSDEGDSFEGSKIGSSGLRSISIVNAVSGYDDIGFRINSLPSLQGSAVTRFIENPTGLNLSFVSVGDAQNISDDHPIYEYDRQSDKYILSELFNLGVVNNNYRIGKYPVTNEQYSAFLNIVAQFDDQGLYDTRMSSENMGGIDRYRSDENNPWEYTVKTAMNDKPVVFVDYISILRFLNWLHHGAPDTIEDYDFILNSGAYDIFTIGTNSYIITKNTYQRYWLPNLNQWHKAAYFEPLDVAAEQSTSAVMIKRETPYLVGSGLNNQGLSCNTFANLSVSGWLYVDHLIVGDGLIQSASKYISCNGSFAGGVGGPVQEEVVLPPGRKCNEFCTEVISATPPVGGVFEGIDDVTGLPVYCVCPCSDPSCTISAGGQCSCNEIEPPVLIEVPPPPDPSEEEENTDPGNIPFDPELGPGFF